MSRRSIADRWTVITWHKEGLTVPEIYFKTGFDKRFIKRWISRFESGAAWFSFFAQPPIARPKPNITVAPKITITASSEGRQASTHFIALLLPDFIFGYNMAAVPVTPQVTVEATVDVEGLSQFLFPLPTFREIPISSFFPQPLRTRISSGTLILFSVAAELIAR